MRHIVFEGVKSAWIGYTMTMRFDTDLLNCTRENVETGNVENGNLSDWRIAEMKHSAKTHFTVCGMCI